MHATHDQAERNAVMTDSKMNSSTQMTDLGSEDALLMKVPSLATMKAQVQSYAKSINNSLEKIEQVLNTDERKLGMSLLNVAIVYTDSRAKTNNYSTNE